MSDDCLLCCRELSVYYVVVVVGCLLCCSRFLLFIMIQLEMLVYYVAFPNGYFLPSWNYKINVVFMLIQNKVL